MKITSNDIAGGLIVLGTGILVWAAWAVDYRLGLALLAIVSMAFGWLSIGGDE